MLEDLGLEWIPVVRSYRLNERHYGALQVQPLVCACFCVTRVCFRHRASQRIHLCFRVP